MVLVITFSRCEYVKSYIAELLSDNWLLKSKLA
uniref:Uncharacterized protein n=1 Tax=Rhizophora mucronata TaxID=61149 RepID=A0A2P2PE57_RHIMU